MWIDWVCTHIYIYNPVCDVLHSVAVPWLKEPAAEYAMPPCASDLSRSPGREDDGVLGQGMGLEALVVAVEASEAPREPPQASAGSRDQEPWLGSLAVVPWEGQSKVPRKKTETCGEGMERGDMEADGFFVAQRCGSLAQEGE